MGEPWGETDAPGDDGGRGTPRGQGSRTPLKHYSRDPPQPSDARCLHTHTHIHTRKRTHTRTYTHAHNFLALLHIFTPFYVASLPHFYYFNSYTRIIKKTIIAFHLKNNQTFFSG